MLTNLTTTLPLTGTDSQPCCQCTPTTCIALLWTPNLDWVSMIWTQLFSPNSSMVWLIRHTTLILRSGPSTSAA